MAHNKKTRPCKGRVGCDLLGRPSHRHHNAIVIPRHRATAITPLIEGPWNLAANIPYSAAASLPLPMPRRNGRAKIPPALIAFHGSEEAHHA